MFHFQGLAQILSKEIYRGPETKYRREILKLVCSRGGAGVPYNGGPFDVYNVIVNYTDQQAQAVSQLKEGDLIWIANGSITSRCNRTATGYEYWNPSLNVNFSNMYMMGWQKPGPSYADHIRVGTNARKYLG